MDCMGSLYRGEQSFPWRVVVEMVFQETGAGLGVFLVVR